MPDDRSSQQAEEGLFATSCTDASAPYEGESESYPSHDRSTTDNALTTATTLAGHANPDAAARKQALSIALATQDLLISEQYSWRHSNRAIDLASDEHMSSLPSYASVCAQITVSAIEEYSDSTVLPADARGVYDA